MPATKAKYILRTDDSKIYDLLVDARYKLAATRQGKVQNWKSNPNRLRPLLAYVLR